MRAALLGFSCAGKKTLFSLLTGRTIPPSRKESEAVEGRAPVRDPRIDVIAGIVKPAKVRYAESEFLLCPDMGSDSASRLWLESARRCDLLCMVVRAFMAGEVYHPKGTVDAKRDRASLETELLLADLETIETRLERISKEKRGQPGSSSHMEEKVLQKCQKAIGDEQRLSEVLQDVQEIEAIKGLGLLTLKPILWIHNVDDKDVRSEGGDPFTVACKIELEIMEIESSEERDGYLRDLGLSSSGVDRVNRAAYDLMGLMSFYTMGPDEVRAWTIPKGTRAPIAAGKIHSDIERGFIRAEIVKYDDLVVAGSEEGVKKQGKFLLRGKEYVMEDGDICEFRFSV